MKGCVVVMHSKIGVLGDRESILGFAALRLDVHSVEGESQALDLFQKLVQSEEYAVLYVTEALAEPLRVEMGRVKGSGVPAVTVIPNFR